MYDYLEGQAAGRSPGRLVLDVHGVGYELTVPLGAAFTPPLATHAQATPRLRVFVHQVVREDEHRLYGFPDSGARDLFRLLLTVRGVGPAAALGLLSGMAAPDLVSAIRDGDQRRLTQVRGIGAKTAAQLLLDLREKIVAFAPSAAPGQAGTVQRGRIDQRSEDALRALLGIGFSEKEARKAIARALEDLGEGEDVEALVRAALSR